LTVGKLSHFELFASSSDLDRREAEPLRVVRQQLAAGDEVAEDRAKELDALVVGLAGIGCRILVRVEAEGAPDVLVHLDDERRFVLLVRVAVHLHDPVWRVEDEELERVERRVDRKPDELAVAVLDGRLEDAGVLPADDAVDAVGADNQVVAGEMRRLRRLALVMQDDAELARALLHERDERRAREG
jgi:hypothetical protein